MRDRKLLRTLIVAVAIAAGTAGVAYTAGAVTRANTTTIQACQNGTNGLLRVVSSAADCRTDETPLSWNVEGPAGPPGPPGTGGALAFAHVLGDGTLDTSRSSNVVAVTKTVMNEGSVFAKIAVYCFDLSEQPKIVTATVENSVFSIFPPFNGVKALALNATADPAVAAAWGCPTGTNAAALIGGNEADGSPFYAEFD